MLESRAMPKHIIRQSPRQKNQTPSLRRRWRSHRRQTFSLSRSDRGRAPNSWLKPRDSTLRTAPAFRSPASPASRPDSSPGAILKPWRLRARDLKLEQVHQGIRDKLKAFREILSAEGLSASEVAFVGDDVIDLPVMRNCGFSVAVANARRGGQGRSPLRHSSRRRRWGTAGRDRIYSEGAGKVETSGGEVHQGQQLALGNWQLAKPIRR